MVRSTPFCARMRYMVQASDLGEATEKNLVGYLVHRLRAFSLVNLRSFRLLTK